MYLNFIILTIAIVALLCPQLTEPVLAETTITGARQPKKSESQTAVLSSRFGHRQLSVGLTEFPVELVVNPGGQPINAVGVNFRFNQNSLQVAKVDLASSFCQLVIESRFDNQTGEVQINCGKPHPGINQEAIIATVFFKLKNAGWSNFSFSTESQVLANDGFGTNVLFAMENKTIYLQ